MSIISNVLALFILAIFFFVVLGKGADLLVGNLRLLAKRSHIHPVLLGAGLGFLTTMPEFMVGVNAVRQGLPGLSLGNLWGSTMVLFGLILGLSVIVQREIKTDGRLLMVLPSFALIFLSLILGLKGSLNLYDGLILVALYLVIVYMDYLAGGSHQEDEAAVKSVLSVESPQSSWLRRFENWRRAYFRQCWWFLVGLFLVTVSSYAIMEIADMALSIFPLPPFLVGILVFAVGTNLPEIIVMIKAVRSKSGDLSFGHLVGSAVSNVLVLALISFIISEVPINVSWRYFALMIFSGLVMSAVAFFYVSKRRFERWEGFVLLFLYIFFAVFEIVH